MKPTSSVLAARMRDLLARLHPPAPPTARESNDLLNVLQTSFKRQLDVHHPNPRSHETHNVDKHEIPSPSSTHISSASRRHWQSLVSSLVVESLEANQKSPDITRRLETLLSQFPDTAGSLDGLFQWHIQHLRAKDHPSGSDQFEETMNDWLMSTSRPSREQFLLSSCLASALQILFLRQNESMMWKWLQVVYERKLVDAEVTSPEWLVVEDKIVQTLIRGAIKRHDLTDAASQLLQANSYHLQSGRTGAGADLPILPFSTQRLATAIIWHRRNHGINSELFAQIVHILPTWSASPSVSSVVCKLYSPQNPSYLELYEKLRGSTTSDNLLTQQSHASKTSRKATMLAVLDASKLALKAGQKSHASFLLDFAIDKYPDFLPPRQVEEVQPQLEISFSIAPA